jgi:hypothetical protein
MCVCRKLETLSPVCLGPGVVGGREVVLGVFIPYKLVAAPFRKTSKVPPQKIPVYTYTTHQIIFGQDAGLVEVVLDHVEEVGVFRVRNILKSLWDHPVSKIQNGRKRCIRNIEKKQMFETIWSNFGVASAVP